MPVARYISIAVNDTFDVRASDVLEELDTKELQVELARRNESLSAQRNLLDDLAWFIARGDRASALALIDSARSPSTAAIGSRSSSASCPIPPRCSNDLPPPPSALQSKGPAVTGPSTRPSPPAPPRILHRQMPPGLLDLLDPPGLRDARIRRDAAARVRRQSLRLSALALAAVTAVMLIGGWW